MVFKGNVDREDYIDFANYVFSFNGVDRSFLKLLPKLFKEGTNTAEDTFFIKEGDRLAKEEAVFVDRGRTDSYLNNDKKQDLPPLPKQYSEREMRRFNNSLRRANGEDDDDTI